MGWFSRKPKTKKVQILMISHVPTEVPEEFEKKLEEFEKKLVDSARTGKPLITGCDIRTLNVEVPLNYVAHKGKQRGRSEGTKDKPISDRPAEPSKPSSNSF